MQGGSQQPPAAELPPLSPASEDVATEGAAVPEPAKGAAREWAEGREPVRPYPAEPKTLRLGPQGARRADDALPPKGAEGK